MSRSDIKFHPACELFPLMGESELKELAADIKKKGLISPITRDMDVAILEGRNRLAACNLAGIKPDFKNYTGDDPVGFVISSNIHRRHLTTAQKRDLIKKLLKLNPEKSDRQIAEQTKTSPSTVGAVRKKEEAKGDVSKLDTRKDTKGRKQPSSKPKTKAKSVQLAEAVIAKNKGAVNAKDPPKLSPSEKALGEFRIACETWLPKLDARDLEAAGAFFAQQYAKHHRRANGSAEIPEDVRRAEMEVIAGKEVAA
jgi:ParB-like nuclease domain